MMRGALHRLKTLPFRRSTRFSHFRSNPQIFDTGFSRLFPSYFSPSHHSPRSFPGHPDRAPRSARFRALYAQLEKPVKEADTFPFFRLKPVFSGLTLGNLTLAFLTFHTFLKYLTLAFLTFLTFHTFLKYLTLGFWHIFSWWWFWHILC